MAKRKIKKYVKCVIDGGTDLSKDAFYEIITTMKQSTFGSGLAIAVVNDKGHPIFYDSHFFE